MNPTDNEHISLGMQTLFEVLAVVIMISVLAVATVIEHYLIAPHLSEERSGQIYMFVILPLSLFAGGAIGKAIVQCYVYPAWKLKTTKIQHDKRKTR